jgi:hypothetical protein
VFSMSNDDERQGVDEQEAFCGLCDGVGNGCRAGRGIGVSGAFAAPGGEFATFAGCPTANTALDGCFVSRTVGGEVKIGNAGVPLVNPLTIQGGIIENPETYAETFVDAPAGFETLSRTPEPVPGGLLGMFKCENVKSIFLRIACIALSHSRLASVNATTERAGPPAPGIALSELSLLVREGTAISLPVRVKLENVLLGNDCYIGSGTSPIVLNLTSGSTIAKGSPHPIEGATGTVDTRDEGRIAVIVGTSLVDNTFTVPAANGCGPRGILDGLIDAKLGLPAAAGASSAELKATTDQAGITAVRESE